MWKPGKVALCGTLLVAFLAVAGTTVRAEIIQIDMSATANYDAFGETGEKQYATWMRTHDISTGLSLVDNPGTTTNEGAQASTAYDVFKIYGENQSIGQYPNNGRTFVSQALADVSGAGKVAMPSDYLITTSYGTFEIGKGMTTTAGYTRYGATSWTDPGVYPTGPGTANTSRPWSRAWRAVIRAPLFNPASTTTTARDSPLMTRLRAGKLPARGGVPRGNSLTTAPRRAISAIRPRFSGG